MGLASLQRLLTVLRGAEQSGPSKAPKDAGTESPVSAAILEKRLLSYEEARALARHTDPEVRRAVAARPDTRPEILYYLADDPVPEVRREIALNRATPVQADLRLAADTDPLVRSELAQKIARLAPGLSADEQDRLRHMTYEALELLARDQITQIRQILAETLKDVANAPPALIRQLAHDSALSVAGPILQFSPVLTDDDLLEIIHSGPVVGALSAISSRTQVAATVADAIAYSDDAAAIGLLLSNPSAQIREETLDLLIDRASDHVAWHEPLVRRPQLPARAATRLARLVADALLQVLQDRSDLDAETKAAVAAVVRRRVEERGSVMAEFRTPTVPSPQDRLTAIGPAARQAAGETALETAERLYRDDRLDESLILGALGGGDGDFVHAALAVRAGLPESMARNIIGSQSAKAMVALTWQSGLSMNAAVQLQIRLARIAPPDVIQAPADGAGFPLTAEEMTWQLTFFTALARPGRTGPGRK